MNESNGDVDGWDDIDDLFSEVEGSDATISLGGPPPPSTSPMPVSMPMPVSTLPPLMMNRPQVPLIDFDIDAMLDDITVKMERLNKVKKILKTVNTEVETKARWSFYHANKNNDFIVGDLRTKLKSSGLYLIKNNKEVIPYRFVKEYTDNAFNTLDPSEKQTYYTMARMNLMGRVQTAQRLLGA